MPNRLAGETSPYLQQHAQNPVDWYPWGEEALERARREDRPILLSVGYSACHWCHVMARECFEDAAVAAVMNRLFVNIKVDREERPDLDQIYQTAHQVLAQRPGGWPLTMFLSPTGAPFFGGTYFPKSPRHGLPAFADLCERVAQAWRDKRAAIESQNAELLAAFARLAPQAAAQPDALSAEPVRKLLALLRASFDARHGGFGEAPKFPHPSDLELCLRQGERDIALVTLERMCEGGIYDQLGGGFCRYSVDAHWSIPHFEKMLYDNGPLLGLLADAWLVSRAPLFEHCAAGTAGWLMREMQSPEGGYYSSLDADSEHEEGRFYVWERDEVQALLGPQDYALFSRRYGLDQPPNFENRAWHLRIAGPLEAGSEPRIARSRSKLFAARERRVRPGRDEKILVSWNALAIRGMARAARTFEKAEWEASARKALAFVRTEMWRGGRLRATYKDGRAHLDAYLDDYAFLLDALLELLQLRFGGSELEFACALADVLLEEFEDHEAGGFFFTGASHEKLIHRPKSGHDNATASGNAVAASALARLSALSGRAQYAEAARRTLELFHPAMQAHPGGFAAMALAVEDWLSGPKVLVLRGPREGVDTWRKALAREYLPDTTVLSLAEGESGLPGVLDKPVSKGAVNGWLCRGVTCLPPINDLVNLVHICKEPT